MIRMPNCFRNLNNSFSVVNTKTSKRKKEKNVWKKNCKISEINSEITQNKSKAKNCKKPYNIKI